LCFTNSTIESLTQGKHNGVDDVESGADDELARDEAANVKQDRTRAVDVHADTNTDVNDGAEKGQHEDKDKENAFNNPLDELQPDALQWYVVCYYLRSRHVMRIVSYLCPMVLVCYALTFVLLCVRT
jgi:hypothetical protein